MMKVLIAIDGSDAARRPCARSDGGAADGDHLVRQRVHDDAELAAGQDVAAEHHADDQDDTDDSKHQRPRATRPVPV